MFAVIVESKEALAYEKSIMTQAGEKFWVTKDDWGPSGTRYKEGEIPDDLVIFKSRESAERFAKRWGGHPWWVKPNGKFEVVEVQQKYKQAPDGFERVTK